MTQQADVEQTQSWDIAYVQKIINGAIEDLDLKLREINKKIHENPELGYEEYKAHDNIVAFLRGEGLSVTPHSYGLETSLSAEYGTDGRIITFNAEYDALPGIGHACGHNLIATSSIAAFLGVVAAMKRCSISGRVRLLGTPAEESGGGKIKLINAGAYEGVHASLMTHPMSAAALSKAQGRFDGIAYGTCISSAKFMATFTGKPAHAAAAPYEGINALDAAVLAYNGVSMLRQQTKPDQRIQGVILEGGDRPNIITPHSLLSYNVRAPTVKETRALQDRVIKCFEGAALATGCQVEFNEVNCYADLLPNRPLCLEYSRIMAEFHMPQLCRIDHAPELGPYSTDMGNVSYVCPSIHPIYGIPTPPDVSNHTPEFADAAGTDEAHRLAILSGKAMAGTAWRVLADDSFWDEVAEGFERDKLKKGK